MAQESARDSMIVCDSSFGFECKGEDEGATGTKSEGCVLQYLSCRAGRLHGFESHLLRKVTPA